MTAGIWVKTAVILAAGLMSGCAASIEPQGYSIAGDAPQAAGPTSTTAASTPASRPVTASGYQLTEEEKSVDCRRLTGRMKIRIMALKDGMGRAKTSELSRTLQSATSTFGGSSAGIDPYADERRDREMLAAYNQHLASKGCKTLDLDAELTPGTAWTTDAKPAPAQ